MSFVAKDDREREFDRVLEEGKAAITDSAAAIEAIRQSIKRAEQELEKSPPRKRYFPMADFIREKDPQDD